MTTRYQTEHYEDVARILRKYLGVLYGGKVAGAFADLFTADSPPVCRYCRNTPGSAWSLCVGPSAHEYGGGFDRGRFLAACGLEAVD